MLSIDRRIETEVVQNKIDRFLKVGPLFIELIEPYAVAKHWTIDPEMTLRRSDEFAREEIFRRLQLGSCPVNQ